MPAALARLSSPLLTQIHFSIEVIKGGDLSMLNWDAVDVHLARRQRAHHDVRRWERGPCGDALQRG